MKLLLDTKCYVIDGKPYYRIHLSTKQARALGLNKGDQILVEVIEIKRATPDTNLRETTLTEAIS